MRMETRTFMDVEELSLTALDEAMRVVREAARGQLIGQWLDEGLANYVAYTALRPYFPESENRRYALWLAGDPTVSAYRLHKKRAR